MQAMNDSVCSACDSAVRKHSEKAEMSTVRFIDDYRNPMGMSYVAD